LAYFFDSRRYAYYWKGFAMKYHISELIDAEKVQKLMERFYEITKVPCTLTDPNGNVLKVNENKLLSSGWQKICLDFHRKSPDSLAKCIESDTVLSKQILASKKYSLYQCRNGLVDGAIPIFVEGEHVVNLFTGQFFLEPPDIDYFRRQANEYGYDVEQYINALREVPVLDRKTVEQGLLFLGEFAELIAVMGLKEKQLLDLKSVLEQRVEERTLELSKAHAEIKTLTGILPICSFCKKIRDDKGYWEQVEVYINKHSEANFSHSVCPNCAKEKYADFYKSKDHI
jgi:ligand-binding sensor protein